MQIRQTTTASHALQVRVSAPPRRDEPPAGFACNTTGIVTPKLPCDPGFFCRYAAETHRPDFGGSHGACSETNTKKCDYGPCPTGYQCPGGTGEPEPCLPGFYSNRTGMTACAPCEPGERPASAASVRLARRPRLRVHEPRRSLVRRQAHGRAPAVPARQLLPQRDGHLAAVVPQGHVRPPRESHAGDGLRELRRVLLLQEGAHAARRRVLRGLLLSTVDGVPGMFVYERTPSFA